mmetsp:Transcript_3918/g.10262  ORF Transcript_3918/g.10262 Transcript_3918/m.10262 type:complete len:163 (+) Transcript_3918:615-1103(+)
MNPRLPSSVCKSLVPNNGVSYLYMNTTVAALKILFHQQKEKNFNLFEEQYVFGRYTKLIIQQAKKRKPIQDKKNYVEKLDCTLAPMKAASHIAEIKNALFKKGMSNFALRTMFLSLCDQMLFLFSTKGILCCDSLFKSELSNLFHIQVKRGNDPHPLTVFIF